MSLEREKFNSRLGFILVAAGCAVGLGNVWRFPYLCGQYGGAAFILVYLICLIVIACPILICEIAVGRASQKSVAKAFQNLEPERAKYHHGAKLCIAGNYLLMMFYTVVCGWMLAYFVKFIKGDFAEAVTTQGTQQAFANMLASPEFMTISTLAVIVIAFGICSFGVQKGVEKICKIIMACLFVLLAVLVVNSLMLPDAQSGIAFYLIPDFDKMVDMGIGNVIFAAMSQAFFTLSIGIGAMSIFGSYLDKKRSLTGESLMITGLDTIVAIMSGLVIIPACFAFNIQPDAGPSLIFITMPNVFAQMPGGQIWGSLFFLFMTFAALSTVVAVFENIIAFASDSFGWSRKKIVIFNGLALSLLSMPCILGYNVLSNIEPLGDGSTLLDLEDFLVSNNFLPLGALLFLLFCVRKNGWGWENFIAEVDSGNGLKFPIAMRFVMTWILPVLIVIIYLKGYYDMFVGSGTTYLIAWLCVAATFLIFVGIIAFGRGKSAKN